MNAPAIGTRLDPFDAPLRGVVAIEASAGTGKTFTITQLYLRLVLERDLPVRDILVVTYTKAATAELRGRIRGMLATARDAFRTGTSEDAFCRQLLARTTDRVGAGHVLERALHGFDEAAVFTIHGFCQRVLAERAFESGVLFDTELVPDQQDLVQEIVDDFWRRELYSAAPTFVRWVLEAAKLSPDTLARLVRDHAARPYRRIDAPDDPREIRRLEETFLAAGTDVRERWEAEGTAIEGLLATSPALKRNLYPVRSVGVWCRLLGEALAADPPSPLLFERFEKFTTAALSAGTKALQRPPAHPFFAACDGLAAAAAALRAAYECSVPALKARLLSFAAVELGRRKQARRVQYYDDLLVALERALADGKRGEELATALGSRYRAALVDEFQDTDPVQYDIFRRIYAATGAPLFLVGDPKQAIYGFRGADVFTYLRARSDAEERHHLDRNWRSTPRLIAAVNAVFAEAPSPFVVAAIPFVDAVAADTAHPALVVDGDDEAALRLWLLGDGDELGKDAARHLAAEATAHEVARLVARGASGRAHLGKDALHGGHIAILVRKNEEGRTMRERLLALGIASVQQAVDSVFASREASELERVLLAVASPGQATLLRGALATELLGASGAEILRLGDDERAWEVRVDAFHDYHHLWRASGFAPMSRELLWREGVPARLLAYDDGERRLTNLLHLAELLQTTSMRTHGGIDALVEWLAEQRRAVEREDEEQQLRLESDERLVKIVTVHKSKGLEYPIVFCPFLWDGRLHSDHSDAIVFHEDDEDPRATLDLGSPQLEARRRLARREELAERVRLLYVALTRAAHRCYVAWGRVNEGGTSPLAWLLHAPTGIAGTTDPIAAVESRYRGLSLVELQADLDRLVARSAGTIRVEGANAVTAADEAPREPAPRAPGAARRLTRPLPKAWTITSFSRLAAGLDAERPDHDATRATGAIVKAPPRHDVFGFPHGARAGTCLHGILERIDFSDRNREAWARVVRAALHAHGFEATWEPVVLDMLARVVATPLDDAGTLRLDRVDAGARLDELEFLHPIAHFDAAGLRRLLLDHSFGSAPIREAIAQARFPSSTGFMKGFIDLVFASGGRYWLVDYKSNHLGDAPEDYAAACLPAIVAHEAYWLQYLVYTVVVHRLLRLRLADYDYERHMGGVRYLFLRGMDPARGAACGVYQDRPSRELVEALDAFMGGGMA